MRILSFIRNLVAKLQTPKPKLGVPTDSSGRRPSGQLDWQRRRMASILLPPDNVLSEAELSTFIERELSDLRRRTEFEGVAMDERLLIFQLKDYDQSARIRFQSVLAELSSRPEYSELRALAVCNCPKTDIEISESKGTAADYLLINCTNQTLVFCTTYDEVYLSPGALGPFDCYDYLRRVRDEGAIRQVPKPRFLLFCKAGDLDNINVLTGLHLVFSGAAEEQGIEDFTFNMVELRSDGRIVEPRVVS